MVLKPVVNNGISTTNLNWLNFRSVLHLFLPRPRPPVLTWQIAREAVGGVCKPDPPEPGAGVDEAWCHW